MQPQQTRRQFIISGLVALTASTMMIPAENACSADRRYEKSHSRRKPRVMIDPGHGGKDPGAIGHEGTEEKHVVLKTAKYLQAMLTLAGVDVILTRTQDVFVPLYERVQMAHYYQADLFVSVHADGFTSPTAHGASVYALSTRGATSAMAQYLSESENAADMMTEGKDGARDHYLQQIIFDLQQTETIRESLLLGSHLVNHIAPVHPMHALTTEQAGFVVLKSPFIPSVLVETAFITNATEEELLSTASFRYRMAHAISDGIVDYLRVNQFL